MVLLAIREIWGVLRSNSFLPATLCVPEHPPLLHVHVRVCRCLIKENYLALGKVCTCVVVQRPPVLHLHTCYLLFLVVSL